nr:MAG TPA: nucelotide kinase [Caudoviricetes sp.]
MIKYVCREADKGGIEDLKKAVQYLEFEIERRLRDEEERGKD